MDVEVIYDDSPMPEREDRPRARTWPTLPPPIETIHENQCDAEMAVQRPPIIEETELETDSCDSKKNEQNPRKNARKNAWGNLSYSDLITQAIQASPEQRLTLSQIYDWMVRNIPYFKDKGDSTSSAGWKNSIRHNLSLHSRFMRVQNDNNGKSSYWVINPDAKPGKSSRRRAGSVDGQGREKSKRPRSKKLHQSTDDIASLSPGNAKFQQNRSYDNLFSSPCSSTDSLCNLEEFHPDMVCSPFSGSELACSPYSGENFARPRSTSNVSLQSNATAGELEDELRLEQSRIGIGQDDETTGIVDAVQIGGDYNFNSINLDDSLKLMSKQNYRGEQIIAEKRVGNETFCGNGDSGYESPAYFSPPQQHQNGNIHCLPQISTPTSLHPGKPPPPYNQNFSGQMFQQDVQSYYPPHQSNPKNFLNRPNVPKLKHLPYSTSLYPCVNGVNGRQKSRNFQNPRFPMQNFINKSCLGPVKNSGINPSHQLNIMQNNNFIGDIPSDLDQVKLYNFDDQRQLARDLNQIIESELKGSSSSLQSICEPMNKSNNTAPTTTPTFGVSCPQNWVM